jgi:bifunctional non-homologous end joining protein LigD
MGTVNLAGRRPQVVSPMGNGIVWLAIALVVLFVGVVILGFRTRLKKKEQMAQVTVSETVAHDSAQSNRTAVRNRAEGTPLSAVTGNTAANDEDGRPSFNLLQNHGSTHLQIYFYVFDVMIASGRDVCGQPLEIRLDILHSRILPKLSEPIRPCAELRADLPDLIRSVKQQQLEGLVAKRRDSVYEAGQRSAAWQKMRINQGQELVIGGYTIGGKIFDALVLGYYQDGKLLYASRTRNGFTPALREQLYKRLKPLQVKECPFANLPERHGGRWEQGLTAAKMKDCCWIRPELVGQFEFVEWTPDGHLRHTRFVGLRDDKKATEVRREA